MRKKIRREVIDCEMDETHWHMTLKCGHKLSEPRYGYRTHPGTKRCAECEATAPPERPREEPCPFDGADYHVSRWKGKHTGGEHSDFQRRGNMLVVKKGATVSTSLLREPIPFGKHKGTPWGEVPIHYLEWICRDFRNRRTKKRAQEVLQKLKKG